MLPFTTYTLPERTVNKTPADGRWLIFIADQVFSPSQTALIQKIGTALKADFDRDTFSWSKELHQDVSIQDRTTSSSRLLISFGITPSALGLWMDLQAPGIRYLETFSFILTLPITELEKNAAAKKELWKNMQMFMEMNEKQNG